MVEQYMNGLINKKNHFLHAPITWCLSLLDCNISLANVHFKSKKNNANLIPYINGYLIATLLKDSHLSSFFTYILISKFKSKMQFLCFKYVTSLLFSYKASIFKTIKLYVSCILNI